MTLLSNTVQVQKWLLRTHCQVHMILQNVAISKQKQEEMKTATLKELSRIQSRIKSGWPTNKKDCGLDLREYWDVKETLTAEEGFILRNEQIVIPPPPPQ